MILQISLATLYGFICLYATLRIAYRTSLLKTYSLKEKIRRSTIIVLMLAGAIMSIILLIRVVLYIIDPSLLGYV